jgi:hypothetical protein
MQLAYPRDIPAIHLHPHLPKIFLDMASAGLYKGSPLQHLSLTAHHMYSQTSIRWQPGVVLLIYRRTVNDDDELL